MVRVRVAVQELTVQEVSCNRKLYMMPGSRSSDPDLVWIQIRPEPKCLDPVWIRIRPDLKIVDPVHPYKNRAQRLENASFKQ